ncbi:unnamed protein product [Callosobruchus maculatus]|uniref:Regulatory protein zeste n=1 Tax=Callosobruchus maculatus TaxID=64391 RepID=A0A653CDA9_CALMS|nr:unnamed protein product [Callosobruchus maculatus]
MCWKKVEEEFNEHDKDFKDWRSLKIKYNNLKRKTKLKFSENKLDITQTGGGPYREVKIDPVDLAIKDIIGPQLDGFSNIYDNDADERIEEPEKMIQIVVDENTNLENMAIDDENTNLECVAPDDNDAAHEKDNIVMMELIIGIAGLSTPHRHYSSHQKTKSQKTEDKYWRNKICWNTVPGNARETRVCQGAERKIFRRAHIENGDIKEEEYTSRETTE